MWATEKMINVMNACVIIHNMIVEERREMFVNSNMYTTTISDIGKSEVDDGSEDNGRISINK